MKFMTQSVAPSHLRESGSENEYLKRYNRGGGKQKTQFKLLMKKVLHKKKIIKKHSPLTSLHFP